MKRLYSIQIYRSVRFRVLHFLLLLFFVLLVAVDLYDVMHIGFSEYFFPNRGPAYEDAGSLLNWLFVADYFLTLALELVFIYLSALAVFCNKILVFEDKLTVLFAPRMYYRLYKSDISRIYPIDAGEMKFLTKLVNYNFCSEHLYKFVCYDDELIISSKDTAGMQKLMADINPRGNLTEKDEADYNPLKLNREEKLVVTFLILTVTDIIEFIYNLF